MYETNNNTQYPDYGVITSIINDKLVNVNMGGQKNADGSLAILESVMIQGMYVPKIGDWVTIQWSNGQPIAIGGSTGYNSAGLTDINQDVKIVSQTDITSGVINSDHIRAYSIQAQHISANSIVTNAISANAVTADKIAAGAITALQISANSITGDRIVAGTITSQQISANSITGDRIAANTISGNNIAANTITGNNIAAATITGDKIAANTITAANIAAGTITAIQISANTITGDKISGGTIDASLLNVSARIFGLQASYYQGIDAGVTGAFMGNRIEGPINFNWGTGAPSIVGTGNNWSARWQGLMYSPQTGQYTFYITADDGAKLWVDNQVVVDGWSGNVGNTLSGTYSLSSGNWYMIRLDYYQTTGNASVLLEWKKPSDGAKSTIPAMYLTQANTTIDGGQILTNSISAASMKVGTITAASGILANASITTAVIADGTITHAKIGLGEIQTANIATGNITTALIQDASITNAKIASIDASKITAGYISAGIISGGTITGYMIAANTISGNNIAARTILTDNLQAGAVTATEIAAGSITGDRIQAGTITGDEIAAGSITTQHITTQGLDAQSISVYNSQTGQTLIGTGYVRVDGLDVGVVQSDNLLANGLFLTSSSMYGFRRSNNAGDSIYGQQPLISGSNQIWKYDLSGNTIVDKVTINGKRPAFMAIDETGTYGYVTTQGDNTLAQIDLVHDTVIQTLQMGTGPGRIKSNGDNKHMFVLNTDPSDMATPDSLFVIDRPPNSVSGGFYIHHELPLGNTPIDWVKIGNTAYITLADQGDIAILDISEYPSMNWKQVGSISIAPYMTDNYHGGLSAGFGLGEAVGGTSGDNYASGGMMMGMNMYGGGDGAVVKYTPKGIEVSSDNTMLYVADSTNGNLVIVSVSGYTGYVMQTVSLGGQPTFVKLVNGKVFVTLNGTAQVAVIDESAIMAMGTITPRFIDVGNGPFDMVADTTRGTSGYLYVSLSTDAQVAKIDVSSEMVVSKINAGPNTMGLAITPDSRYLWIVNNGNTGFQSFVYPSGNFIGDPYMGLEGDVVYQGADYWMPNRSDWIYDSNGDVQSYSLVEFHINEPLLNEGGYAKLVASGKDNQFAQIEQDIINVTNFSNGSNTASVQGEILTPSLSNVWSGGTNSGNATWFPKNTWLNSPVPSNILISGSNGSVITPSANQYTINYSPASITFSGGVVPSGSSILANYTYVPNVWFKNHNGSVLVATENGASNNFYTHFEIDELVPKFVVVDNLQTTPFTPTADGINQQYTGMGYSSMTNRVYGIGNMMLATGNMNMNVNMGYVNTVGSILMSGGSNTAYTGNTGSGNTSDITLVTDGITTSTNYFDAGSGNAYIQIDLGEIYMIDHITIWRYYADNRVYSGNITQISTDGTNWTNVWDYHINGTYIETSSGNTIYMNSGNGCAPVRYIRDWISGNSVDKNNRWVEIQAFGDWQVESKYVYPSGTAQAGQQMATNGQSVTTTSIPGAHISYTFDAEFTTYWWVSYLTGPEFGSMYIRMPDLMSQSHYLFLTSPVYNKVAHRHLMPLPPGQHTVQIFQNSGKISVDRFRFEDFQYYTKTSTLIPSSNSSYFTQYKIIANQAQNYIGKGRQSTFGAFDTQRVNPSTGLPDNSVPIKYRLRVKSEIIGDGTQKQGTTYVTSAIVETGKLSTHWRMSESAEHIPFTRMESWDPMNPMKTGVQTDHIADGAIQGTKLMPFSVMNYHISPYARIPEFKLDLNFPTKDYGGISGNYGTGNTVARTDHLHDGRYLMVSGGGTISGNITVNNLTVTGNSTISGNEVISGTLTVTGNVYVTGNVTTNGTINGINIVTLNTTLNSHIGAGGSAHALVVSGGSAGFMSGADKAKLDGIQSSAINQTTADGRYLQLAGGSLTGTLTSNSPIQITSLNNPFKVTTYSSSSGYANYVADWASSNWWGIGPRTGANDSTVLIGQVSANSGTWLTSQPSMDLYIGANKVWHSGNMGAGSGLNADLLDGHDSTYFAAASTVYTTSQSDSRYAQLNANNIMSGINTFNASANAVVLQPTVSVPSGTVLFALNTSGGSTLITMDGAGNMVVKGNLTVSGTTTYSQTSTSSGNSSISGDLIVSGNSTLGATGASHLTTVNGDMYIAGNLKQSGKYMEVARTPIFGIGGDGMFYSNTISGNEVITKHYNTFLADGSYWMPAPQTGASRYYKALVMYSISGSGNSANLTVYQDNTSTQLANIPLPQVWGVTDGSYVRSILSSPFQVVSSTNHTQWDMTSLNGGDMVIKYIELIAYDYYS
jgi:hypothetical protein